MPDAGNEKKTSKELKTGSSLGEVSPIYGGFTKAVSAGGR
jgi:hypothetical protein